MIAPAKSVIATVESIRSPRPEKMKPGRNFYILMSDIGKMKGFLGWRPARNQKILATAMTKNGWTTDRYDGSPVFEFAYAEPYVPTDTREVLNYAASLTKGMGEKMADALWRKLGGDWKRAADGEVPGFTGKVHDAFLATLRLIEEDRSRTTAVSWLCEHGASINMAAAAWEAFGSSTIGKVSENCYVLAYLPHYSFIDVDMQIRVRFGIGDRDARRVDAAVRYFMNQLSQESTVVKWDELWSKSVRALRFDYGVVCDRVKGMFRSGELVPFAESGGIANSNLFRYERDIFEFVEEAVR